MVNSNCGIYKITNLINNKVYIGQSIEISKRWKAHISYANNKLSKEYNTSIHNAIRKYGENNFKFEIIENCRKEDLDNKEKYWIKFYDSINRNKGYNLTTGGMGGHKTNCKAVLQYDLEGNFIKEWSSIWQVEEELNISANNIRACCCGQKSAGGFQWKYYNDTKEIKKYQKNIYLHGLELGRKSVPIMAKSIKNGEKFVFNSITEGAKWLKKNQYSKSQLKSLQSRISTIKDTPYICCGFYWITKIEGGDCHS